MYGEKVGLAFAPVGIYDFANKLEYTTETDFNGIYDVLMPSTNHISCPTPSGVCATCIASWPTTLALRAT